MNEFESLEVLPPETVCNILSKVTDPASVSHLLQVSQQLQQLTIECIQELRWTEPVNQNNLIPPELVLALPYVTTVIPPIEIKFPSELDQVAHHRTLMSARFWIKIILKMDVIMLTELCNRFLLEYTSGGRTLTGRRFALSYSKTFLLIITNNKLGFISFEPQVFSVYINSIVKLLDDYHRINGLYEIISSGPYFTMALEQLYRQKNLLLPLHTFIAGGSSFFVSDVVFKHLLLSTTILTFASIRDKIHLLNELVTTNQFNPNMTTFIIENVIYQLSDIPHLSFIFPNLTTLGLNVHSNQEIIVLEQYLTEQPNNIRTVYLLTDYYDVQVPNTLVNGIVKVITYKNLGDLIVKEFLSTI